MHVDKRHSLELPDHPRIVERLPDLCPVRREGRVPFHGIVRIRGIWPAVDRVLANVQER
jgi:hypothetical protein